MSLKADDILKKYQPDGETITVTLPHGEQLKFRAIQSFGELQQTKLKAAEYWEKQKKFPVELVKKKNLTPVETAEDAYAVYVLMNYSVEPKFSEEDAKKLTRAPWLVTLIMNELDFGNKAVFKVEVGDKVEEEKKD